MAIHNPVSVRVFASCDELPLDLGRKIIAQLKPKGNIVMRIYDPLNRPMMVSAFGECALEAGADLEMEGLEYIRGAADTMNPLMQSNIPACWLNGFEFTSEDSFQGIVSDENGRRWFIKGAVGRSGASVRFYVTLVPKPFTAR